MPKEILTSDALKQLNMLPNDEKSFHKFFNEINETMGQFPDNPWTVLSPAIIDNYIDDDPELTRQIKAAQAILNSGIMVSYNLSSDTHQEYWLQSLLTSIPKRPMNYRLWTNKLDAGNFSDQLLAHFFDFQVHQLMIGDTNYDETFVKKLTMIHQEVQADLIKNEIVPTENAPLVALDYALTMILCLPNTLQAFIPQSWPGGMFTILFKDVDAGQKYLNTHPQWKAIFQSMQATDECPEDIKHGQLFIRPFKDVMPKSAQLIQDIIKQGVKTNGNETANEKE